MKDGERRPASTGSYIPEIGLPDPAALAYLNEVWPLIPKRAEFRRYGEEPANLRELIRSEAEAIRIQAPFREVIVREVEKATGESREEVLRTLEARHG